MTQELYLAEIIEKSIGTYSNALTKSLSRHIARDILKHFIIKRMNTNEELKTRPDFEKYFPISMVNGDRAIKACNDLWTTHVEPLQAENVDLKKDNEQKYQKLVSICGDKEHEATQTAERFASTCIRLTKELHAAESENQKLREALKEANDTIKELEKFDER